jgi:hypothetical protein
MKSQRSRIAVAAHAHRSRNWKLSFSPRLRRIFFFRLAAAAEEKFGSAEIFSPAAAAEKKYG